MKWTREQLAAIETHGTNILVSAGAGSGKTTVLTERLFHQASQGKLKRLLVLTFTNAAASEMREKIRKRLMKEPSMMDQLDELDGAYFTTFDSYAQSVVRKYSDVLHLSPTFQIDAQKITSIERKKIMGQLFHERYESQNQEFLSFVKSFAVRDDSMLVDMILRLSFQIDQKPDPIGFLSTSEETGFESDYVEGLLEDFVNLGKDRIHEFELLITDNVCDYLEEYKLKLTENFASLFSAKTIDEMSNSLRSFPRIYNGATEFTQKYHKWLKDFYTKKVVSLLKGLSSDELIRQYLLTKNSVKVVKEILKDLFIRLAEYKLTKQVFEFNDISRFAFQLVNTHPEVAQEIAESFDEILVDEYQDTNAVQDLFLKQISRNNIYMVGDIKQSIYRFRHAEPSIFQEKFRSYGNELGGVKIDLVENFRSRPEVINHINALFRHVMVGGKSEIDYQNGHEMRFGRKEYLSEGAVPHVTGLEVHTYEWDSKEPPLIGNQPLKKEELEFFHIGNQIKQKVRMQWPIFDGKTLRPAQYDDFTILIDRSDRFMMIKQIFDALQIPLIAEKDEDITSSYLPRLIKNIFILIHHQHEVESPEFKYAFTSIARSFLYRLSDEDILRYMMDEETIKRSQIFLQLAPLSSELSTMPLDYLMKSIFSAVSIYDHLIEIGDVIKQRTIIDYLLSVARTMAKLGYDSYSFVEHIEQLFKYQEKITYPNQSQTVSGVHLMTIHKSKGLEFNIVYYPGLYKHYNYDDLKSHFSYDDDYGFVFSFSENGGYGRPFVHILMKERMQQKERAEKLRLLYVALTRAKESMIVVLPRTEELPRSIQSHDSFAHIFDSLEPFWNHLERPFSYKNVDIIPNYDQVVSTIRPTSIEVPSLQVFALDIQTKAIDQQHASKSLQHLKDDKEERVLQLGTQLHYILEIINFKQPDLDRIDDSSLRSVLQRFIGSSLLRDVQRATILKEVAFVTSIDGKDYRGIIDLVLVFPEKVIVIDYKTSSIDDPAYDRQLTVYYHYLLKKFDLPIDLFLYSLFQGIHRRVEPIPLEMEIVVA